MGRHKDREKDKDKDKDEDQKSRSKSKSKSKSRAKSRSRSRKDKRDRSESPSSRSSSDSSGSEEGHRQHKRAKKDKKGKSREERKRAKREKLEKLMQEQIEKKKQLLLQRMKETPEERMRRKLEKKRRKEEERLEQLKLYGGFTSESNPWADSRLTDRFVWGKKNEKLREQGLDPDSISKEQEEQRKRELVEELAKLKRRKAERELEKQLWEEEKSRLQREREMAEYADWEEKEDMFHLQQIKRKSAIRLEEGRPRPIDMLYKNLLLVEQPTLPLEVELDEPYNLLARMELPELEEIRKEILERISLRDSDVSYWEALLVCCDDEVQIRHRAAERERMSAERRRFGLDELPAEIADEIDGMFSGKNYEELVSMEEDIRRRIQGSSSTSSTVPAAPEKPEEDGEAIDIEYWENVLKRLQIFKAKAYLRDLHGDHLEWHLVNLEKVEAEEREEAIAKGEYYEGWEEDRQRRRAEEIEKRASQKPHAMDGDDEEAELYMEEASKPLDEDEEIFTDEVQVESKPYSWFDKYRPRKPRYFNRIHTGYDWNKYNSTHYDHDNPPPKTVQGYKFNIFYPDLIDKETAPYYKVEPESNETCIIRFHAGPPYEDLCFRIANKEWEYSRKRGFRNTFERGVLQVHFRFRRYRYRR